MIAFEIRLNGQLLGTAGTEDLSVLSAIVTAAGKLGPNSQGAHELQDRQHIELRVGGLTARAAGASDEHLDWVKQMLKPGDVVTVTVVNATSADVPVASQPARTDDDHRQQFEWAKNFYFENREKFDGG
jgi:hypothetical protein